MGRRERVDARHSGGTGGAGGEIQLADAINKQAALDNVESVILEGRRFDCGNVNGYLEAITYIAGSQRR